jgi:hypothetical protein
VTGRDFPWYARTFVRLSPWGDVAHILQLPKVEGAALAKIRERAVNDYRA